MGKRQKYRLVITREEALEDSAQVILRGEGVPANVPAYLHCVEKHHNNHPFAYSSALPKYRELAKRDMRNRIAHLLEEDGVEDYLVY